MRLGLYGVLQLLSPTLLGMPGAVWTLKDEKPHGAEMNQERPPSSVLSNRGLTGHSGHLIKIKQDSVSQSH